MCTSTHKFIHIHYRYEKKNQLRSLHILRDKHLIPTAMTLQDEDKVN